MNVENNRKRAARVLEIARAMAKAEDAKTRSYSASNSIESIQLYLVDDAYSEPGYSADVGVAVGNWNPDLAGRVGGLLEKLGLELEWEDEVSSCGDCNRLVRTQTDSYSWSPSYAVVNDCELICHECLEKDPEQYLRELEGDADSACIESINPGEHGYTLVEKGESGWYACERKNLPCDLCEAQRIKHYQDDLRRANRPTLTYNPFEKLLKGKS